MYKFENRDDGMMAYVGDTAVANICMTEVERYVEVETFKDVDGKTKDRYVVREKMNVLPFDRFRIHFTSQLLHPNDVQALLNELAEPKVLESFEKSRQKG